MITYTFLQQYWWLLVTLLGALLVFLMFVQGANSLIFSLGKDANERQLIVRTTGRKWELTFTTLVTFGGAFLLPSLCFIVPVLAVPIGCGCLFW